MRREKLQLLRFALIVKDLDGSQPAGLRGAVHLPQVAEGLLARAIDCAHRLDQRPVGVTLAILLARVWPQKHPGPIVSSLRGAFKRAGLHYIVFFANRDCRRATCCHLEPQKSENRGFRDELGLTHTVLTLDVWTQSAPPDTDAGSRLPGSGARVSPEIAPMSSGSVDSASEAATTTCVALRAETPSVGPRCAGPHGTGNIREPPTGATPQCPWSSRAGARAVSAESASTWLPFACRSSSGTPGSIPSDDSSHRYE